MSEFELGGECENCGQQTSVPITYCIDVVSDPGLAKEFIAGSIPMRRCPICGEPHGFPLFPFVYWEKDWGAVVVASDGGAPPEWVLGTTENLVTQHQPSNRTLPTELSIVATLEELQYIVSQSDGCSIYRQNAMDTTNLFARASPAISDRLRIWVSFLLFGAFLQQPHEAVMLAELKLRTHLSNRPKDDLDLDMCCRFYRERTGEELLERLGL